LTVIQTDCYIRSWGLMLRSQATPFQGKPQLIVVFGIDSPGLFHIYLKTFRETNVGLLGRGQLLPEELEDPSTKCAHNAKPSDSPG
jgi:hypothetical protein